MEANELDSNIENCDEQIVLSAQEAVDVEQLSMDRSGARWQSSFFAFGGSIATSFTVAAARWDTGEQESILHDPGLVPLAALGVICLSSMVFTVERAVTARKITKKINTATEEK